MGELLGRLIQLRYEYFNQLSFEDLDVILGDLPCSTNIFSEDLIKVMREYTVKNYNVFDFNIRTSVNIVVSAPYNAETLAEAKTKAYEDIKTSLATIGIGIDRLDIEQEEV